MAWAGAWNWLVRVSARTSAVVDEVVRPGRRGRSRSRLFLLRLVLLLVGGLGRVGRGLTLGGSLNLCRGLALRRRLDLNRGGDRARRRGGEHAHRGGRVVDDDRGGRVVLLLGGQRRDVDLGGDVEHRRGGRGRGRRGFRAVHQVDPTERGGTHDGQP